MGILPFPNVLSVELLMLGSSVSDSHVAGHSWDPPVALCISGMCPFLLLSSAPLFGLFIHLLGHGGCFQVFGDCE